MPDWSYHTLFRPALFALSAEQAQALTLNLIGGLARVPFGSAIIELFGHMRTPAGLACSTSAGEFASPLGLSARIDPNGIASAALGQFGFGLIELGPITPQPVRAELPVQRLTAQEALAFPYLPSNVGAAVMIERLSHQTTLPRLIRLAPQPNAGVAEAITQCQTLIEQFEPLARVLVLDISYQLLCGGWATAEWQMFYSGLVAHGPLWAVLPTELASELQKELPSALASTPIAGVVIEGGWPVSAARRGCGPAALPATVQAVRRARQQVEKSFTLIASGGVQEPQDTHTLLQAGADLILINSGLVYAGPGLPKRINELLAFHTPHSTTTQAKAHFPAWLWMLGLGAGMMLGGLLAWLIAATVVILPYDEAYVGLTRAQLAAINPRLLPFMTHDRITLAGTMLALGVLYLALVWNGVRVGEHWAARAMSISAVFGFASFFLFLGFGYFDPLHALVSVILLAFYLLGRRWPTPNSPHPPMPDGLNDAVWRRALWGQLLFVIIGMGLIGAGSTIMGVGVTTVFVVEDLRYMGLRPEMLNAINERIIPLIAHDRAGFGGALVANGLVVLFTVLWGFRRGARWLWWALVLSGVPGFATALGVHFAVGYIDWWHLFPGIAAMALYLPALALLRPYLCHPKIAHG